jgi:hypothetical protein
MSGKGMMRKTDNFEGERVTDCCLTENYVSYGGCRVCLKPVSLSLWLTPLVYPTLCVNSLSHARARARDMSLSLSLCFSLAFSPSLSLRAWPVLILIQEQLHPGPDDMRR